MNSKIIISVMISILMILGELPAQAKDSAKTEPKPTSAEWSKFQGKMNWEDAKVKCTGIGMRLPTIEELKAAYAAKLTGTWQDDGAYYWSSTPVDVERSYILGIFKGVSNGFNLNKYYVRCLR